MNEKSINYERFSATYDSVRDGNSEMVSCLLEGIMPTSSFLALDIGCGTANNTILFAEAAGASVIGLDLSHGMLKKASLKVDSLPLVQADAESLPFLNTSFDFVFMTEVIHHITNVETALSEIHRVLNDEGRVCIVTQSHKQIERRLTSRFFPDTITIDKSRYPKITHLENYLVGTGFSKVKSRTYTFRSVRLGRNYLETIENRGYSMLHKISNSAFKEGLSMLRNAMWENESLDNTVGYTYVWAKKC